MRATSTPLFFRGLLLLVLLWTTSLKLTAAEEGDAVAAAKKKKKDAGKKKIVMAPGITARVVGGNQVTKPNRFPYFVEWEDAKCGGSLIHDDIVLTAAHCENYDHPFEARVFMLGVQSETGVFRTVERQQAHPLYRNEERKDYDYMILKLHKSALVDNDGNPTGASTIELNKDRNVPEVGQALQVLGYGLTDENAESTSEVLNEATIYYISDDTCRDQYGTDTFVPDLMFCGGVPGGGVDTCQGDSGGPIVAKDSGKQVGVVSFGIGCAREEYAGVSARVSSVTEWIEENVCAMSAFPPPGCASVGSRPTVGTGDGELTVHVQQDTYPSENAWSLTYVPSSETLFFQPFENDLDASVLQEETFSGLPAGLYNFRMADDGDDGICCDYGPGKFWITDDTTGEKIYESDGKFGTYLELSIRIDESGNAKVEEESDKYLASGEKHADVKNYPQRVDQDWPGPKPTNPNSIHVVVKFDTFPQETSWELSKLTAPGVWSSLDTFDGASEGVPSDEVVTAFTDLSEGWYRFSITDEGEDGICCNFRRGWVALNGYLLATRRSGMAWGSSGEFGSGTEVYLQMNPQGLIGRISNDPPPTTG